MKHYNITGNQITFTDQRFYELEGKFYPSVTTILSSFPKTESFYKWLRETGEDSNRLRDEAGEKGSQVHNLTEQYDNGLEVSLLNSDGAQRWSVEVWHQFSKYVEFRNATAPALKIHAREMNLIDPSCGTAGTLDTYCEIDGKHLILDIKTGKSIYPHFWCQLAIYRKMFENLCGKKIDGVGILHLNSLHRGPAVGKIQGRGWALIMREDSSNDLKLWEATKLLWLAQNEDAMPRNISYQLSHKLETNELR